MARLYFSLHLQIACANSRPVIRQKRRDSQAICNRPDAFLQMDFLNYTDNYRFWLCKIDQHFLSWRELKMNTQVRTRTYIKVGGGLFRT